MNKNKLQCLFISLLLVLTAFSQMNAADILSGRVYEGDTGTEPPTSTALSGVTVRLYGSNNLGDLGTQIGSTTTDSLGWYGLTATVGYEYYTIVETDPSDYYSAGATSVDGTVINDNQIRYSTASAPLSDQTLTGNKFWDKPNAPANNPPIAEANGPYTGKVGNAVTLDGSGSYDPDAGDSIVSYEWDIDNDGQYDDATGVTVQHTWNSVYNGAVGLRVTDSYGETDTDSASVLISENEPRTGTIIVEKQTEPDSATDVFTFSGDVTGSIMDGGQLSLSNLQPGTYTSQEIVPQGWNLISIQCDDDNSSGDVNTATATFRLEAGETVKAVFTNRKEGAEPELDFGDAPDPTYPTFLANNGARHQIDPDVYLGTKIDYDSDGQPNSGAIGDDDDGNDDEDGVVIKTALIIGSSVNVEVTASTGGYLNAWVDFSQNGSWGEADDHVFINTSLNAGLNNLTLNVPGDASPGVTIARFRFSRSRGLSYVGEASDGEVEDYSLEIDSGGEGASVGDFVWNDLNKNGLQESGEPGIDSVSVNIYDAAGNPVTNSTTTNALGFYQFANLFPAQYSIMFSQPTGYTFSPMSQGMDPTIDSDADPMTGRTSLFSLSTGEHKTDIDAGMYQLGGTGEFDFGDAPDPTFPTILASNGARHVIKQGFYLGAGIDAEPDGYTSSQSDGDDLNPATGTDDEDGVTMSPFIAPGQAVPITIVASDTGVINAWLDFNIDGDWADANEQFITAQPVFHGANSFTLNVPGGASLGLTHARFRFSSVRQLSYDGLAADGEVEDYAIMIKEPEDGSVIIIKDATPKDDTPFQFYWHYTTSTMYASGFSYLMDPSNNKWTILNPGNLDTLLVSENVPNGWALQSINITGDVDHGSVINGSGVLVDFDPGENIVITFNNKKIGADDQLDFGDAPAPYPTLKGSTTNIISRQIETNINFFMGNSVDSENDGQPDPNALGDDNDGNDDEDGVTFTSSIIPGQTATIDIDVTKITDTNFTGQTKLWGVIDFNSDGLWGNQWGEEIFNFYNLTIGTINKLTYTVPAWAVPGKTFARFMLVNYTTEDDIWVSPLGEVEDYEVVIGSEDERFDFGDAPDSPESPAYPTLLANNGARHIISSSLHLGSNIDAEPDGQPSPMATGDDQGLVYPGIPFPAGDEDGVLLPSIMTAGQSAIISVISSASGVLNAWLDFNINSSWADAGEHMIAAQPVVSGVNSFTINIPANAQKGQSYARFRLSTDRSISYDGIAPDGEVEDYAVALQQGDGGTITIIKDATPKDDTPFWITTVFGAMGGAAPFRDPSANTATITNGPVGIYYLGESVPAGWTLTDIVVTGDSDNGSVIDVSNATVQIDLDAGENITVVFKNNKTGEGDQYDFGDAPSPYPTKHADNGAYHLIDPNFKFGQFIDAEDDGLPDPNAQGDDNDNLDDESEMIYVPGFLYFLNSTLQVPANSPIKICFCVDWERDGSWKNNCYDFTVNNSNPFPLVLDLSGNKLAFIWPPGIYNARWRCYKDTSYVASPTGFGGVGEVEDCQFIVTGDEVVSEYDYGDAPLPYPTQIQGPPINSYGGRHPIVPGIHLGQTVDPEADGQPNPNAEGDDNDGSDDEDGVFFITPLLPGQPVSLEVAASVDGYLNGYIDLNQDQDWADPNEQIFFEKPLAAGANGLTFTLPANAKSGGTFARFRFSTQKLYMSLPQQNVFLARDGEVEDYEVFIDEGGEGPPIKWKQPPLLTEDPGYPFAPCFKGWDEYSVYRERVVADDWFCKDPRPVTDIHWWGSYVGWDSVHAPQHAPYEFHIGVWTDVPAGVDQPWSHPGELVWEWRVPRELLNERSVGDDFVPGRMAKPDTCFQYDFFIPQDQWFFQEGDSTIYWLSIAAVYDVLPDSFVWGWKTREHYFHGDAVRILGPKEFGIGSMVEFAEPIAELWDVAFVLTTNEYFIEFDFGDAPDSRYPTMFAQNGAHHIFTPGVFLGSGVDPEVDGQPEPGALGDDNDGNDDEDGVVFLSKLQPGNPVNVEVRAAANGFLNAWMDFNNNGSWADPDEHIFIDQALVPGTNALTFIMPSNAFAAPTFARFRFSSEAHVPFFGLAIDGEVEDYYIEVNPVGVNEINEPIPTEFKLMQNFPNPFNPTTEIRYEIPKPVFVRLALYNLSGQEIAILVSEQKFPGSYIARWNGKDKQGQQVAAGIYLYRIEAGYFNGTGKLLLLK